MSPVKDQYKLVHSNQGITDVDLQQLRLDEEKNHYEEIDFSCNELTSKGLHAVLKLCQRCSRLRVLRLYRNNIDDEGAEELAGLCKQLPWMEELHLSHNRFTEKGADVLVTAAAENRPDRAPPLWLRLEQNDVSAPRDVFDDFAKRMNVCLQENRRYCSNRKCCYHSKVHLPLFTHQRSNRQKGGASWRKSRRTVVLSARPDVQHQDDLDKLSQGDRREEDSSLAAKARSHRDSSHEGRNGESYPERHERSPVLHHRGRARHQRGSERERADCTLRSPSPQHRTGEFNSSRHRGTSGRAGGESRRERREPRGLREDSSRRGSTGADRRVQVGRQRLFSSRGDHCSPRRRRRHRHHSRLPEQHQERVRLPEHHRERPTRARPRSSERMAAHHEDSGVRPAPGPGAKTVLGKRQWAAANDTACAGPTNMERSYSSSSSCSDVEGAVDASTTAAENLSGQVVAVRGMAAPGSFVAAAKNSTALPTDDRGPDAAPALAPVDDEYSSPTFSDSLSEEEGIAAPDAIFPMPPPLVADGAEVAPRSASSSCEREQQWEQDRGCPPPSPSRSRSRDALKHDGPGHSAKTRMETLKERLTQKWQRRHPHRKRQG